MRFPSPSIWMWPVGSWALFSFLTPICCAMNLMNPEEKIGEAVVGAFVAWTRAYAEADEGARAEMLPAGIQFAEGRMRYLEALLETNPQTVLDAVIPTDQRASLPPAVRRRIERPFQGEGLLELMIADDFERGVAQHLYFLHFQNHRYRAYLVDDSQVAVNQPIYVEGFLLNRRALLTVAKPR